VFDDGKHVAHNPAHPMAEEGPEYKRPLAPPPPRNQERFFSFAAPRADLTPNFLKLLASPAIASKRWVFEQYDTMIRTNTLVGPGAGDAAVIRIKESAGGRRPLALSTDGNGRWCYLNPRVGAMHAVAEAARNVACTGARPLAATNCLNFGNPEKPEVMRQFSEVVDGISESCTALGTPITGGNVSFYNETLGKSIYPTPVIGMLGVLEDSSRALGSGFRASGDAIVLLDGLEAGQRPFSKDATATEFSSSEYAKTIAGVVAGTPPAIDLPAEKRLIECLVALASEGAIRSAHDVGDGGLATTLAECCFASDGLSAHLALTTNEPAEVALFGERGARAVVSVARSSLARVLAIARQYGVAAQEAGQVTGDGEFRIELSGHSAIRESVAVLRGAWANSLERMLQSK
jgi:phosphoribosylformylglycinamidine synthase